MAIQEHYHGCGTVGLRSYGTELETVAGEGKGRGAVAVGIVHEEFWYLRYVQHHALACGQVEDVVVLALLQFLQYVCQLSAEEGTDDGRRCLVCAKTVCIGGADDGCLEQAVVAVHGHQRLHYEGDEAEVVHRCLSGGVQEYAGVGGEAPVVVLAATVYALERLFVQEAVMK